MITERKLCIVTHGQGNREWRQARKGIITGYTASLIISPILTMRRNDEDLQPLIRSSRARNPSTIVHLDLVPPDPLDGADDEPGVVVPGDALLEKKTVKELDALIDSIPVLTKTGKKADKIAKLKRYREAGLGEPGSDPKELLYDACVKAWFRTTEYKEGILQQFVKGHKVSLVQSLSLSRSLSFFLPLSTVRSSLYQATDEECVVQNEEPARKQLSNFLTTNSDYRVKGVWDVGLLRRSPDEAEEKSDSECCDQRVAFSSQ